MLTCIRIRDLAIIRELELELSPGLNVVTGETGAGKSILIAALKLVLGARGGSELVRNGADSAVVEALFDLSHSADLRARVEAEMGTEEDELLVRRVLRANGRSRCYINGSLATAAQLSRLTGDMVDICSQHEHHTLVDATSHLLYLDAYAGLDGVRQRMRDTWQAFTEAAAAVEELAATARNREERELVLRFQLEEIDTLKPVPGEDVELEEEHERLAHAENLSDTTRETERYLYTQDAAVCTELARQLSQLEGLRGVDADLDPLIDRLSEATTELEDLARDLSNYRHGIVHAPGRLSFVEDRLAALRRLSRKFGGSLESVLAHREQAETELNSFLDVDGELDRLDQARQVAADEAGAVADELSRERQQAAAQLADAITLELSELGMGGARVEVDVARTEVRGNGLEIDGAHLTATGMDRVEFLIAPNPGEPPKPLRRIASGGELSRSLLAVKRVLARRGPRGLYVFDEVDTGVGGAIAEVIGRKLEDVSNHHQVLCITHQPQIAAFGQRHFHVSKAVVDGRTESRVVMLEGEARTEELARMMGGIELTDVTRAAADELLQVAARQVA